jgi:sulfite reductase alpha subunit-like flavoprotein
VQKPFDSQILHARYLTKTPNDAAKEVAELQVKGDDKDDLYKKSINEFERRFPLAPNNGTVPGKSGESTVAKNGKRVMELTLRLPDDYTLEYAPGDSLGLLVDNPPATVAFILGMLEQHSGLKRDQKISVDGDQPLTAEQIVRSKIDLSSPLKNKRILASLAQFATCPTEAFALQWLASKSAQGQKAFDEYIDKQKITVADLLRDFPSCQSITMEGLVSILPCVPPRYYSVSSSPLSHQNESLTIAFSVVDYVTPSLVIGDSEYGCKRIHGVATTMMEMLCAKLICGKANGPHDTLPIFPKPTAEFRMPATLSTPLILIGPGTGVAPFIGFLQHRQAMMSSSESEDVAHKVVEGTWRGGMELDENEVPVGQSDASGLSVAVDFRAAQEMGSVDLFFGCRHEDHDWLYREEMVAFKERGILSQLYTAFSRGKEKQYVQDVMRAEPCRSRIIRLITKMDACVYLCGDGNVMAKDVQAAVVEMLSSDMKGGLDEAVSYLETMKRKKRFVMDIWS